MIFGLYCIYDKVAEEAGPVFQAKTEGVAVRKFVQLIQGEQVRPEEFVLLHVGQFQTDPVSIEGVNPPRQVEIALSLYKEAVDGPSAKTE